MTNSGGNIGQPVFKKIEPFPKNQGYFPSGAGLSSALLDCPHGERPLSPCSLPSRADGILMKKKKQIKGGCPWPEHK
jgi:hypothetical protein